MPNNKYKKILVLGSGGLKIGQAGEFDYSGTQAIKAFQEETIQTVLINPNIATIQTSEGYADKIYFLPLTLEFITKVIEKEKPDAISLSFGGQTALNAGVELYDTGILKKYNIEVLGTSIDSIKNTEDRGAFANELNKINVKTPISLATDNVKDAIAAAQKIGFPIMLRVAFALGGKGSGICKDQAALSARLLEAFSSSNQVLIEEWLGGWKEIEYEVVRDISDNAITVCNMENLDPLGIHTGESIVVAPSQTLSNREYFKLREISIKVAKHFNIVGECNVQFALNPNSEDYRVIELNARLSRSSALASKATGYPLAFIAAKLSLGFKLHELENKLTKVTKACFEPALDYVVVKAPRWDLKKFKEVDSCLGSEMKSVGEVMSIGRTFEEALQKALRMINTGMHGLTQNSIEFDDLDNELKNPTDRRIFAIGEALKLGYSIEILFELTKVNAWFLYKLKNIIDCEIKLQNRALEYELLLEAKKLGFSDYQISKIKNIPYMESRNIRQNFNIKPFVKQIDTLAGEYPAKTNYLYMTYNASEHDIQKPKDAVIVLGSGSYRIGSSVEFDWCCVNSVNTVRKLGLEAVMINYNPETVSTDYDMCDRLYFEEMSLERVLDIYEFENSRGIIVSMGGQIPNNLALRLHNAKVKILGTHPEDIDKAEDRHKFSTLLDTLKIEQPKWKEMTSLEEAKKFANSISYPVLIRPSYVLSGAAMNVVWNDDSLEKYLNIASKVNPDYPVVISKFEENAKEIEYDAVAKDGLILIYAISEHIENAGVHSGDATIVLPAQKLYVETIRKVKRAAREIAKNLNITGPFNIQILAKNNRLKVIECNLRASRTFPFCSKVFKQNFIELATKAILNAPVNVCEKSLFEIDYVGVKAAQFSFSRLKGADPILGVEMASTGEVACLGNEVHEAFLKAFLSVGFKIPIQKNILLSTGPLESKTKFLQSAAKLKNMGYKLFATAGTHFFLKSHNITSEPLNWPLENTTPNVKDHIINKKIDLVINIPKDNSIDELRNDYFIRRLSVDHDVSLVTNLQVAIQLVDSLNYAKTHEMPITAWDEY